MRGFAPGSNNRGAIPYLKQSRLSKRKVRNLPGSASAKVDGDDVRILRIFFQECHLNLNLLIKSRA